MIAPSGRDSVARKQSGPSARFQRQRERIVDVAVTLLNQKGVRGMTLLEVAQSLDLTTTSLTYYFRYKEQLAAAVFEDSLTRLAALAKEAGEAATPKARVARYLELYFDHFARSLRGEVRPFAILSEIRALEDATSRPLVAQYQAIFRDVRAFFGEVDTQERKLHFTARAQLLNEALFWSAIWLAHYAVGDFDNVRRRMFYILEHGVAAAGCEWRPTPIDPDESLEASGNSAFLRVATRLINDTGYRGASVDRIMAELNLTKGSFYHHLDAKDDLILECFLDSYRRLKRLQILADRRGDSVWQDLSTGIASALTAQFDGEYPLLRTTALQAMPASLREVAVKQTNRTANWLTGRLVEGMQEGSLRLVDPVIASHIIMSTINSAYDVRNWAKRQGCAKAIRTYAKALMNGVFDEV